MSIVLDAPGSFPPDELVEGVVGVVVTYRPPDDFDRALDSFLGQLPLTIVVSNDDDPGTIDRVRDLVAMRLATPAGGRRGSVSVVWNRKNLGLSAAFNQGVAAAESSAPRFVLLLDQDTCLHSGAVRTLVDDFGALASTGATGAVGCTNLEGVHVSEFPLGALDRVRRMYRPRSRTERIPLPRDVVHRKPTMVNSGTLIASTTLRSVGPFDERLFIDGVDYDYSFRMRRVHLEIFSSEQARADHRIGALFETHWLGRTVKFRTYSTGRSYYIVRDTMRLLRKWFTAFPIEAFGIGIRMLIGVLGSLAILPDRHARAQAVLAALRDAASVKPGTHT